jgi:hypothetical protein
MNSIKLTFLSMLASQALFAEPVVETSDRLELDWARMRASFYGVASGKDRASWSDGEKAALEEGLAYLVSKLPALDEAGEGGQRFTKELALKMASSTYITETKVDAQGQVTVALESLLPRAFTGRFAGQPDEEDLDDTPESKYTSIVVKLDKKVAPRPFYTLVDQDGDVVYEAKHVAKTAFERFGMGRWYTAASGKAFQSFAGSKPYTLTAKWSGNGRITVDEDQWEELERNGEKLIKSAKIALILP